MSRSETILVTGASGLLGANIVHTLLQQHSRANPVAVYGQHSVVIPEASCQQADLTDAAAASALIESHRPAAVVHCAALTNVDKCQEEPELARRVHVDASRHLAEAVASSKTPFVYISTDAVYPGDAGPYGETDATGPVNLYAETKLEGERAVQAVLPNALVVRTNIYGWNLQPKQSLAEWILNRLIAGERVPGFVDVFFSPILVNDLAGLLIEMMDRGLRGVYNVAGSEGCSKYDFAVRLAERFGFDPGQIDRTSVGNSALKAPRPRSTPLIVSKVERDLGHPLPGVDSGLERFCQLQKERLPEKLESWRG